MPPPPPPKDFLTNCADAFLALFADDSLLNTYPWQAWDSDAEIGMPRGYLNMEAEVDVDYGGPSLLRVEAVLEGKPKRASLAEIIYRLQATFLAPNLHTELNTKASGKVQFYQRAERVGMRVSIRGDVRQRIVSCQIAAISIP